MATEGSIAGCDLFDNLNISYEQVYKNNPFKTSIITHAIHSIPRLDSPNSKPRVLDAGCGTGIPVSQMLTYADMDVQGFGFAPEMVNFPESRAAETFVVSDVVEDTVEEGTFAAVFMIFAHLQLVYGDFHSVCWKFAKALRPGGLFVIGQMPADNYVKARTDHDSTGVWVEDYDAPFWGEPLPTFMMTAEGQRKFLTSMGFVNC